jgi:hypothetical protein
MERAFIRALRVGVSAAISYLGSQALGNDLWITATPVISAVGKLLREKFNLTWLPF